MALRSEDPPAPGNIDIRTPPDSAKPTTAMLKADIDSGRTGDKIPHYDPGLSQLGTDDEAAGNAPSHERVALARETEAAPPGLREAATAKSGARVLPLFIAFVVIIPCMIAGALLLFN